MTLDLYYTPSTCSLAAHIALEEAGIDYTAHFVKLYDSDAQNAYRAIIPAGKVPALRIDGTILMENIGIMGLAALLRPEARLLPADPIEAAHCLSLLSWFASTMQLNRRQSRAPVRFTADATTYPSLSAAGRDRFAANLRELDERLEGRTWLIGDQFTVADGYALVFWDWALADGFDAEAFPNFADHARRVMERPAVRRVLEQERHPLLRRQA
ncbi:MAG: glutathione binding-like protein [Sphingobium sp.]|nr:glutathione binding-like protein [Sphingobium sp.]